ncbi:MAG: hypothetical protein GY821_09435 [Gammaproteobacteria bacterium]|nr:hypothetical protein [Gammaproteobacteria bacterium]
MPENELKYRFHAFSGTNSSNNFEPSIKVQEEPGTLTVEVTEFTKDKARVNLKYSDSNDVLSQSVSIPNSNNDTKSIIKEAVTCLAKLGRSYRPICDAR